MTPADSLLLVRVRPSDVLARTMLSELAIECSHRYGGTSCNWFSKLTKQSAGKDGAFLVVVSGGVAVAGGAYRPVDDQTVELNRIWTAAKFRRQGLARRVLADLEADIADHGYRRVVLTTGPQQPEARSLYLGAGYRPLYDTGREADEIGLHRFEKDVVADSSLAASA
ncbi:GNAT family N-acetyltransferase [Williamsia soli]|uniref:GNAT family N-acetyltransferase n=1 Tax=Williamsia soli TaxID=364929 RepID=UPI001A9F271C|nr:GNAT family N-acetyltransferase [Williamsia soli]